MNRLLLFLLVIAEMVACGGNVVVDGAPATSSSSLGTGGSTGSGGAISTTAASGGANSSGSIPTACTSFNTAGCFTDVITMGQETCTFTCTDPDGDVWEDLCTAHACTCKLNGVPYCMCAVDSTIMLCGGDQTCCGS